MAEASNDGWVLVGGQLRAASEAHISALDRGFTLGDGVFETFRTIDGRPFRLEDHLARLRASADVLRIPVPLSDEELTRDIAAALRANGLARAVVRLTVSRGVPTLRGLLPPQRPHPTVVVQVSPHHELPPRKLAEGFAVHVSAVRRNESSPAARIKSCSYLDNLLARMEAERAGADEAVMLNSAGYLACCTTANLALVSGARIRTPAVACGALDGITRRAVRELAGQVGLEWEETWLTPADLLSADESFLTNSVLGVVPVRAVDGRAVGAGRPGPATLAIVDRYDALLRI